MEIFDSHAHYDDSAFDADREALLCSLPGTGVVGVLNAGVSAASSRKSAELARHLPFMWAAAGIHPEEAPGVRPGDLDEIAAVAQSHPKVVAIGEIGLDYHYEGFDRETQLKLFESQLQLARDLSMPVIMHDRDAHADTMRLVRLYRPRGVLHCYSGSAEDAARYADMGLYLGFTGVVTFKNGRRAAEALRAIPRERILIETDCPYMSPEPFRGRRCDSSMLTHTLTRVGELLGIPPDEAAGLTAANARRLFGIPASGQ